MPGVGGDRVHVEVLDGRWPAELLAQPVAERAVDRRVLPPGRRRRRPRRELLGDGVQVAVLEPLPDLLAAGRLARARARENLEVASGVFTPDAAGQLRRDLVEQAQARRAGRGRTARSRGLRRHAGCSASSSPSSVPSTMSTCSRSVSSAADPRRAGTRACRLAARRVPARRRRPAWPGCSWPWRGRSRWRSPPPPRSPPAAGTQREEPRRGWRRAAPVPWWPVAAAAGSPAAQASARRARRRAQPAPPRAAGSPRQRHAPAPCARESRAARDPRDQPSPGP